MGCRASRSATEAGPPSEEARQPWRELSGGKGQLLEDQVDDNMIQVFYEFAVDKARPRAPDRSNSSQWRRRAATARSLGTPSSGFTPLMDSPFLKEHFLTVDNLVAMAQDLGFADLQHHEVARIFEKMPTDDDGRIGRVQFASAVKSGPDSGPLQILVQKFQAAASYGFKTPEDYDYTRPTSQMYRMEGEEFTEAFKRYRTGLDYSYHNNYTIERQRWQDEVIQSTVIRSSRQPSPWLVFTCGPMGVGKGYCMNWMSARGFFPLENIVHIDPDAFKLMMPEWPKYVDKAGHDAGTMCHRESSMMMEIAQWAAMDSYQNIWIDGSLRDAEFYARVFEDIRHRYPHYKISIMYVFANEAVIRERIRTRAERTGRDVPENLIAASLGAMDRALNTLTPLCDFVARIDNSGTVPVLAAFETIDTRCSWTVVKDRFARKYDGAGEFPDFLAPVPLIPLLPEDLGNLFRPAGEAADKLKVRLDSLSAPEGPAVDEIIGDPSRSSNPDRPKCKLHVSERLCYTKDAISGLLRQLKKHALGANFSLDTSPTAELTFPLHTRELVGVPEKATHYFWVFPVERLDANELPFRDNFVPFLQFVRNGGFCWCDADYRVIGAHAISSRRERNFLQFEYPVTVKSSVLAKMRHNRRLRTVATPCYTQRGAVEFGWMMPNESFQVNRTFHNVGGVFGAFVFTTEDERRRVRVHCFPVMAS